MSEKRGKMADDGGHDDAGGVYLSGGKGPPKPPPKSRIGLTEVERAISVLEGRHPEHEKLRRQTREAAETRRGQLDIELEQQRAQAPAAEVRAHRRRARGRGRGRRGVEAGGADARSPGRARRHRGAVARARVRQGRLERADGEGLARRGPAGVELLRRHRHGRRAGPRAGGGRANRGASIGGVVLVRRGARDRRGPALGDARGPRRAADRRRRARRPARAVVGRLHARAPGATAVASARTPRSTAGSRPITAPAAAPEAPWLDADPARLPLRRAGLRVVAAIDPPHPFAIVNAAAGDCGLALSAGRRGALAAGRGRDVAGLARPWGPRLVQLDARSR